MKPEASTNKATTPEAAKPEGQAELIIPAALTVKQLSELLEVSAIDVIKDLMRNGVMAAINQVIDFEAAAIVAADFGYQAKRKEPRPSTPGPGAAPTEEDASALAPRPPVVTILGHVDHGKTSLLDAIRQSNIIATEAGEITQHIGAYQVEVNGQKITFLDTPGHEAFTAMRARGAQVTDIAILVVAADDGVMPQTVEAISHAQAAGVPIIVAINKIDKANANPERVKQQLADNRVIIEEWGGDVVCVPISAKTKEGISDLLENLLIVAEIQELKANPHRPAIGAVIEAKLDTSRGPLATVLVQAGTLRVGDGFAVGQTWGRVRAMFDDIGRRVKQAEPSFPVEVLGASSVPQAGDILTALANEKEARSLAQQRQKEGEAAVLARGPRLEELFGQIQAGQVKELNLILKTDVQGSIEPLRDSLERLSSDQVKVRIIHSGSGSIAESDMMLAVASKAIIIGFNSRVEPGAKRTAEAEGIDIRNYNVIYNLVDDVERALKGMLEPTYVEVVEGHSEVRAVFPVRARKVAGCYVTDGKITRGAKARILRGGENIHESAVSSLRHFKDDVREMAAGYECGIGIEGFSNFEIGDIIEVFRMEKETG